MFDFQDINSYVYYLTGYKDLIAPRPIKRFPTNVEKRISHARRKRLKIYLYKEQSLMIFHEFCHFVEANESQILEPNFRLGLNPGSRLRETRVRCIQNTLSEKIGIFANKPTCYGGAYKDIFSIMSCYAMTDDYFWECKHRKALGRESLYRNLDFLIDRLKQNINLLKERT